MEIRPANQDDLAALATVLAGAGMSGSAEVLRWKLLDAPGPDRPRSFVAVLDGQMVGHVGVMPTELLSKENAVVECGWFVDWMVREDLRGRALGVFLLREALRHWPLLMTIQGTADTREALQLLGWTRVDEASVYKLNLRPRALGPDTPAWDRCKAELGRLLYYHPVTLPAPTGWRLITDTDDTLWTHLEPCRYRLDADAEQQNAPARFHHPARLLQHNLAGHPAQQYRLLIAADDRGPAGYAIWRLCSRLDGRFDGRIVDLAAPWDRPDLWAWLVSASTSAIAAAGAVQVQCLAAEGSPLAGALLSNRYLSRQSLPLWLSPTEQSPPARPWHITFADSDIDTAAGQ